MIVGTKQKVTYELLEQSDDIESYIKDKMFRSIGSEMSKLHSDDVDIIDVPEMGYKEFEMRLWVKSFNKFQQNMNETKKLLTKAGLAKEDIKRIVDTITK